MHYLSRKESKGLRSITRSARANIFIQQGVHAIVPDGVKRCVSHLRDNHLRVGHDIDMSKIRKVFSVFLMIWGKYFYKVSLRNLILERLHKRMQRRLLQSIVSLSYDQLEDFVGRFRPPSPQSTVLYLLERPLVVYLQNYKHGCLILYLQLCMVKLKYAFLKFLPRLYKKAFLQDFCICISRGSQCPTFPNHRNHTIAFAIKELFSSD